MRARFLLAAALIVLSATAAHAYTSTPAVQASGFAYNAAPVTNEMETPASPLLAEASNGTGGNTAWARAVPTALRVRATKDASGESWASSQARAILVDHFRLENPGLSNNITGHFNFNFFLTGTMRILASNPNSKCLINLNIFAPNNYWTGQLDFGRIDGVPTLYASSGGGTDPAFNELGEPDGSRRIYATTTGVTGGYHVIRVAIPIRMRAEWLPINQDPYVADWSNSYDMRLTAIALQDSDCDFSSTLEFAAQNPILPDPTTTLPATGWTFTAESGENPLPAPLSVATSTGSGDAVFASGHGEIADLEALVLADFPEGLSGGNFAHGWFAMDLNLEEEQTGAEVDVALPGDVGTGAAWWYHDGAEWLSLAPADDDGDNDLTLQVVDNGEGDVDPAPGVISLAGGFSDSAPVPALVSAFRAAWRSGGVDLTWRAPAADAPRLRLEAHLDGDRWLVALAGDPRGLYTARDADPRLRSGGTVRYDLKLGDRVLETRAVDLPQAALARIDRVAPNPFNPQVEIAYTVPRGVDHVRLAIHDLQGRRVTVLVDGNPGPGGHVASWQGVDAAGRAMPSGTYLLRLETAQRVETRKLSLVR